jgi:hypothetical protein
MLKTVSSVTNAIGALNYKGTWNATTNTPTITSSVGVKGDYYQVSVAGSTAINGISNWGVGDVIAFNGTTWQRIEGGADLNGVNLSVSGTTTLSGLTASTALALNASKDVVSVTNTGTGNNVLDTSPSITTPRILTAINDTNGNELFGVTATGSAVNEFTVANAATGNAPTLSATGGDTNIGMALTPKGTGGVIFPAGAVGTPAITTSGDLNTGIFFPAADTIAFTEDGAEAMRIDSSGNLLVGITTARANAGDVQVSKGISFPDTQSAQSDANTLDDYEEGTWTPTYIGSISNPSINYNGRPAFYVKIGRFVYFQLYISVDTTSGGSGNLSISGLPFTSGTQSPVSHGGATVTWKAGTWATTGPDFGHIGQNETTILLIADNNTGQTILTTGNLQNGCEIIASGWYVV